MCKSISSNIFVFVLLTALFATESAAQSSQEIPSEALNAISETADKICGSISTSGQSQSIKINGDVKAQTSELAKKLANLGISGTIEYNTNSYNNVVQTALPDVIKDTRSCRLHIFDALKNNIFPLRPKANLTPVSTQSVNGGFVHIIEVTIESSLPVGVVVIDAADTHTKHIGITTTDRDLAKPRNHIIQGMYSSGTHLEIPNRREFALSVLSDSESEPKLSFDYQ